MWACLRGVATATTSRAASRIVIEVRFGHQSRRDHVIEPFRRLVLDVRVVASVHQGLPLPSKPTGRLGGATRDPGRGDVRSHVGARRRCAGPDARRRDSSAHRHEVRIPRGAPRRADEANTSVRRRAALDRPSCERGAHCRARPRARPRGPGRPLPEPGDPLPGWTSSRRPGISVPTTGTPAANASMTTRGIPSEYEGRARSVGSREVRADVLEESRRADFPGRARGVRR